MNRRFHWAFVILAALLAIHGCSRPADAELEFAAWILPVPEATPVREYAPVPREERDPGAIVLEEELVIGGDADSMFYSVPQVAVAEDGRIYVLDREDASVRIFSPAGELLRAFGRAGEGPGEFAEGRGITIAGEHLLVADGLSRTRLLSFTLDGDPVASVQTQENFGLYFYGLPDGTFIDSRGRTVEDRSRRRVGGRYTQEGEELTRYFDLAGTPPRELPATRDRALLMGIAVQHTIYSSVAPQVDLFSSGERVYAVLGEEYQALAMTPDGAPEWALRVAWPRPPYPERRKAFHRESAERYNADPDELEFPAADVAVRQARLDGRGRLFIYPNPGEPPRAAEEDAEAAATEGEEDRYVPVDVYSPDGELIAAGLGSSPWRIGVGDHVYGWRHDEETDNWYVFRSRITVNER